MPLVKKNKVSRSSAKRVESKTVMITKFTSTANSPFAKKITMMNSLLAKAKLLS